MLEFCAMALSEIFEPAPASRRERILDVAARHFAEQPYDAVSTVAIAAEAGVNRGWIHHEFGSKIALYVAVLRRLVRVPFVPDVREWPRLNGGLEAVLDAATDAWLAEVEENPHAYLAGQRVTSGLATDPTMAELMDKLREDSIDGVIRVMFPDRDPQTPWLRAVIASFGALVGETLVEWLERGRLSRDQVRVLLVRNALDVRRSVEAVAAREA